MTLTARDLEAIREVVRSELELALVSTVARAPLLTDESEQSDEHGEAIDELAAAMLSRSRGEPGSEARHLRADARYRARYDAGDQARARKLLRKAPDEPINDDEMAKAITHWRERWRKSRPKQP